MDEDQLGKCVALFTLTSHTASTSAETKHKVNHYTASCAKGSRFSFKACLEAVPLYSKVVPLQGTCMTPRNIYPQGSFVVADIPPPSMWIHSRGMIWLYTDGHASWRRMGGAAQTSAWVDPFPQYDMNTGRPGSTYWSDYCGHAFLFRPDGEFTPQEW